MNILDRAEQNDGLELDLSAFDVDDGEYGGTVLYGDSLISMNRFNDAQIKEGPYAVTVKDGILYADIKKLSFCEIVIPCKNI